MRGIEAGELRIGNNVKFGKDIDIKVRGVLEIGDNSIVGDRFTARGENIKLGEYFYNGPTDSRGMLIGGGSSGFPFANLTVGSGMVCHTGHINLARKVVIGNNVGLSHDVDLITHGFWGSVLEGHPRKFGSIIVGNNVIFGWKTTVMPGVQIGDDIVIGSNSVVVKDLLDDRSIYAGMPAKKIGDVNTITEDQKVEMINDIVNEFKELLTYYYTDELEISVEYPIITINNLHINVEECVCEGIHDDTTDAFRDFIRRYGIRVFSPRGFRFNLKRI